MSNFKIFIMQLYKFKKYARIKIFMSRCPMQRALIKFRFYAVNFLTKNQFYNL